MPVALIRPPPLSSLSVCAALAEADAGRFRVSPVRKSGGSSVPNSGGGGGARNVPRLQGDKICKLIATVPQTPGQALARAWTLTLVKPPTLGGRATCLAQAKNRLRLRLSRSEAEAKSALQLTSAAYMLTYVDRPREPIKPSSNSSLSSQWFKCHNVNGLAARRVPSCRTAPKGSAR